MNESLSQWLTAACFESGWSLGTHCGFPHSLGDSVARMMQKSDCCALSSNRLSNDSENKMNPTVHVTRLVLLKMHCKGQRDMKSVSLPSGLMSPTLAPTAVPSLTPAPVQNDLLETGFDTLGTLPSPTAPLPASAAEPPGGTPAPSGGFDASSE